MKKNDDQLNLLREVDKKQNNAQRELAKNLNFSLGKLNYCLKALKKKGYIKIKNFTHNNNKLVYRYLLTPKGINQKTFLSLEFIKRKMSEYDELKKEIDRSK